MVGVSILCSCFQLAHVRYYFCLRPNWDREDIYNGGGESGT